MHSQLAEAFEKGGNLPDAPAHRLWRILCADHEVRTEATMFVPLPDEARARVRELVEQNPDNVEGGPYNLSNTCCIPDEFGRQYASNREALFAWLAQPLGPRQWYASQAERRKAETERKKSDENAARAAAVEAGTYAGPPVQGGLL